ncbi:hypothetical protein PQX77_020770 [Marasmius sp. AFHP31]|nr:hypothetical protein PQX77_020770 [Marasmius sp. AFHP31]
MSASERNPLRLDEFLHDYAGDAALTNFDQGLRSHILCRLLGLSGDEDLPKKTLSSLIFDKNRIYIHRTYRLHYNTYNMRRKAQTINPRTHPDIMMLADAVTTDEEKHPYRYARVLGIFHANVWLFNSRMRYEDMRVQKVEFLWVRWYELDTTHRHGWKAKRFPKVRFLPASDPQAFGFVDPGAVLRGAYLEPAFNDGFVRVEETTGDFLGADSICRLYHTYQDGKLDVEYGDWRAYYVDLFGDRDLFMRHRGGGVGHSTRAFTVDLEREATEYDKPLPVYNEESGEMLQDVPEDPEGEEEEDEETGEDGDDEDEDEDADEESQEKPVPLSLFELPELSSSSDESLRLGGYDSDDDGGDWTDDDDAADGSD